MLRASFYVVKRIVDQIDAERDAMHDKNNMSTSRKGSHIYKEGSTGESEFPYNKKGKLKPEMDFPIVPELDQNL